MRPARLTMVIVIAATLCLATAVDAAAAEYSAAWGPEVGSRIPVLEAPDQTGRVRRLEDLSGEQGLLLLLSRSADW